MGASNSATLRDLLIFVEDAAEPVVSLDLVDLDRCAAGEPRSPRQRVAPGALIYHECSGHHRSRPSRLVAQIRGIRLSLMMTPGVVQNACRRAPPPPPVVGVAGCDAVGVAPGRSV